MRPWKRKATFYLVHSLSMQSINERWQELRQCRTRVYLRTHIGNPPIEDVWRTYARVNSSLPWHYLNRCWLTINWTIRNKSQWHLYRTLNIVFQENAFENAVCEMSVILSQCVKRYSSGSQSYADPSANEIILNNIGKIYLLVNKTQTSGKYVHEYWDILNLSLLSERMLPGALNNMFNLNHSMNK